MDYAEIRARIADLNARAAKSQSSARDLFAPFFKGDDRKPPGNFEDSSFLFMRSCDADTGLRPVPCPMFWVSPDLRVAPLSDVGAPTRTLNAGSSYRLTAVLRNRGDLMIPAAKVEFWLVTPSLGFDTRFATRLGVAQGRVQAHGATEVSIDYAVPPTLAGHFCLFARAFSFSPLDIPVSDTALDPRIDRHVAQQNLTIIGQAQSLTIDWVHRRNAEELLELAVMPAEQRLALRHELVTPLRLVSAARAEEMIAKTGLELKAADAPGVRITTERRGTGLLLFSTDPKAETIATQAELTKQVLALVNGGARDRGARKLLAEYRRMTTQTVRSQLVLTLPGGLKRGQAAAFQLIRRDRQTGEAAGGVALFVTA